jgi:hypothetical protein
VKLNKQPKVNEKASKIDEKPIKVPKGGWELSNELKVMEPKFDFRIHFTTNRKFTSRDEMLKRVRHEAEKLGFVAVVAKSNNKGCNRKTFVVTGC